MKRARKNKKPRKWGARPDAARSPAEERHAIIESMSPRELRVLRDVRAAQGKTLPRHLLEKIAANDRKLARDAAAAERRESLRARARAQRLAVPVPFDDRCYVRNQRRYQMKRERERSVAA